MGQGYVLVQESCDMVQGFYQAIIHLLAPGIEVLTVKRTSEAKQIVNAKGLPTLAIVDCCPPINCEIPTAFNPCDNGLATIQFLNEHINSRPAPKIILTTTRAPRDLPFDTLLLVGKIDCIFQKPFEDSQIIQDISRALGINIPIPRKQDE